MGVHMKALAFVVCACMAVMAVEATLDEGHRGDDLTVVSLEADHVSDAAHGAVDDESVSALQEPMDLLQLQTGAKEGAQFESNGRTPLTPVTEGWSWSHYTLFNKIKNAKMAVKKRISCIRICNSDQCVGKDNKGKRCLLNPTVAGTKSSCTETVPGNGKVCMLNDAGTACASADGCAFKQGKTAKEGGTRCAKPDAGCKFVPKPVDPDTAIKVTEKEKEAELKRRSDAAKESAQKLVEKTKNATAAKGGNSSENPHAKNPVYKAGYAAGLKAKNKTAVDGTDSQPAKKKAGDATPSNADLTLPTKVANGTKKAVVANSTSKPAAAATNETVVANSTSKPAAATAATKNVVANSTSKPAANSTSKGAASRRLLKFNRLMRRKISPEEADARMRCNCTTYRHDPVLTPKPMPAMCEGTMADGTQCALNNVTTAKAATPAECKKKDVTQTAACELNTDSSGCTNTKVCVFVKGTPAVQAAAEAGIRCAVADSRCKFTPKQTVAPTKATCTGTTFDGKSCKLHPGAAANCGSGKDAEGNPCALNEARTGCAATSGNCSFTPGTAAGSTCDSTDTSCKYTPAMPWGLSHPTNGASCVGTDAEGKICKLNEAVQASCSGKDTTGQPCRINLDKTGCEGGPTCKFYRSRLAATKCAVQTGSCKFTHAGGPDLTVAPGRLQDEGQTAFCNFKHRFGSKLNTDGSKGLPFGVQANSTGKNYKPTDVYVDTDKPTNWSYVDFGPSMSMGAPAAGVAALPKDGLNMYNSNDNSSMTSRRFFMHEFWGSFFLEAGAKYRFSVRGRDGAKLWLAGSPAAGPDAKGAYISKKRGCSTTACVSDECTKFEFDQTMSKEITGDGYWRSVRIQLAKAKSDTIGKLFLRILKNGKSMTMKQMNIRTGSPKCDGAEGASASCAKACQFIRDHPTAWGRHPADFVDVEKQGKPIEGCRYYEKPCCQGAFKQFGPDRNQAKTNINGPVASVVCSKGFVSWMFQQKNKKGASIMLDGDRAKTGMACLKRSQWGQAVVDWDGKVKSTKVCELDKEKPGGKAHRRRRGVVNCRGGVPEWSGWKPTVFPATGKACDFVAGEGRHDKKLVPADAIRLKNITLPAFVTSDGPPSAKPLTATDAKFVAFDAGLHKQTKADGYMQQFEGQVFLKKDEKYKFALRSNAGSKVWLQGAASNPVVEWKGCHAVGAMSAFDEHESVDVVGDGKWHVIIVYYAHFARTDPAHLFLRVKAGSYYLTSAELNIRHNGPKPATGV